MAIPDDTLIALCEAEANGPNWFYNESLNRASGDCPRYTLVTYGEIKSQDSADSTEQPADSSMATQLSAGQIQDLTVAILILFAVAFSFRMLARFILSR